MVGGEFLPHAVDQDEHQCEDRLDYEIHRPVLDEKKAYGRIFCRMDDPYYKDAALAAVVEPGQNDLGKDDQGAIAQPEIPGHYSLPLRLP